MYKWNVDICLSRILFGLNSPYHEIIKLYSLVLFEMRPSFFGVDDS